MQKDLIALKILFCALLGLALTENTSKALALSDVPPAVQQTIQANLNGRSVTSIEYAKDKSDVSYEVDTKAKDGAEWDLTVAENGTLLSIDVPPTELPSPVQTAITAQVGKGKLEGVAKQFDDGITTYLAGITAVDGIERDYTFAEDGTLVKGQVSLSELPPVVQTAITAEVAKGKLEGIEKTLEDGDVGYEATMTTPAGEEQNFTVDEDGTLVSLEVDMTDLPPPAQKVITALAGENKITGIDETFTNAMASYEATTATSTGQLRDFSVTAIGYLKSREVFLSEIPPIVQNTVNLTVGNGTLIRIDQYFGALPHYEIEAVKDGAPLNFKVGPKGKFRGMEN